MYHFWLALFGLREQAEMLLGVFDSDLVLLLKGLTVVQPRSSCGASRRL